MVAMLTVQLHPFDVPSQVIQVMSPGRRALAGLAPCYPLSELSPEILATLCDDFRHAVFEKAGKEDPK